jgi:hypothetical protein
MIYRNGHSISIYHTISIEMLILFFYLSFVESWQRSHIDEKLTRYAYLLIGVICSSPE